MSIQTQDSQDSRRAVLSALMDGDGSAADEACRLWRGDVAVRADWHAYHLIGDLMRSDEHPCDAARDAHLLKRVREQMAAEPVLLAPVAKTSSPNALPRRRARSWMAAAAVAAGFVVVAGALVVTRVSAPGGGAIDGGPMLADAAAPESRAGVDNVPMIRSAELDRYLAAHRQYANGAVQVTPGGGVRNAATVAPGR
jgi:sigma-E factor negative regulatory protein RseA